MTKNAEQQDLSLLPMTTMKPTWDKEDSGFTLVKPRNSSAKHVRSSPTGTTPVEMTRKTSTGTNADDTSINSFVALSDKEDEKDDVS